MWFQKKKAKPPPVRTTTKSNNCNGCKRQLQCPLGYYTYDSIDQRQWTLWEKFTHISIENEFLTTSRPDEINQYMNWYTEKRTFSKEDLEWLEKYLAYEESEIFKLENFSKCARAYIRYMGMRSGVVLLKNKIDHLKLHS